MIPIIASVLFNPFVAVTGQSIFTNLLFTRIQRWIDKANKKMVFNEALKLTRKKVGKGDTALNKLRYDKKHDTVFTFTKNKQFNDHFSTLQPASRKLLVKNLQIAFENHARVSEQIFNDWMVNTVKVLTELAKKEGKKTKWMVKAIDKMGSKLWEIHNYSAYTMIALASIQDDTTEIKDDVADIKNVIKGLPRVEKNTEEILGILKRGVPNTEPSKAPKPRPAGPVPREYIDWLHEKCLKVETLGLELKQGQVVRLDRVYVPVLTSHGKEREKMESDISWREKQKPAYLMERITEESIYVPGAPGSGKSTFVNWLTWLICNGTMPEGMIQCEGKEPIMEPFPESLRELLPLRVPLRSLMHDLPRENGKRDLSRLELEETLEKWTARVITGLRHGTLTAFLEAGRTLLLLDGVDEVSTSVVREGIEYYPREMLVNGLCDAVPQWMKAGNRILLTSRPYGMREEEIRGMGLHRAEIMEMTDELQELYLNRWFVSLFPDDGRKKANELMRNLQEREELSDLRGNPVMLTAMCVLFQDGSRLPECKADLYKKTVDRILFNRYRDPMKVEIATNRLSVIAYGMHTGLGLGEMRTTPQMESSRGDIDVFLRKYMEVVEGTDHAHSTVMNVREGLLSDSGLLLPSSRNNASFWHPSFQEYLAAREIKERYYIDRLEDSVLEKAKISEWRNTLGFVFGLMVPTPRHSKPLLKRLIEEASLEYLGIAVLAADCLEIFLGRRDYPLDETDKKRFKNLCLDAVNWNVPVESRFDLVRALGILGDPRLEGDNFVEVPAGKFLRGSKESDEYTYSDERPQKEIWISRFWIGKYPVTNQEFKEFVDAGGYDKEKEKNYWSKEGRKWRREEEVTEPLYWHDRKWNCSNFPVVGISWYEAEAYANWLSEKEGKKYRLPTEAEWEKAARGTDGRTFPWGEEIDGGHCNYSKVGLGRTSPVGIFPNGESPYHCLDMAGNVDEWCADWFSGDYYSKSTDRNPKGPRKGSNRVFRGGGWYGNAGVCSSAFRGGAHPGYRDDDLGFRLVRSV